jgi:hypothetical protein
MPEQAKRPNPWRRKMMIIAYVKSWNKPEDGSLA